MSAANKVGYEVSGDKLADLTFRSEDAPVLLESLKARIRRLTWLDEAGQKEFHEVLRAARMCYELSEPPVDGRVSLTGLSREDVEILYAFPIRSDNQHLNEAINEVRLLLRDAGPVGPVEADRMAKGFVTMMNS